jgi:hypothetical protein
MSVLFSWRKRAMLEHFMQMSSRQYMRLDEAQTFDQRPFRSMLYNKYIAYYPGHGFKVTQAGMDAWNEFHNVDIFRKDPTLPLTAYFDPTAYNLKIPAKKGSVHVMPKAKGAA